MRHRQSKSLILTLFTALILCSIPLSACGQLQTDIATSNSGAAEASADVHLSNVVVGVAWRPNAESLSYKSTWRSLEAAGITYVLLPQAHSADFSYDADDKLTEGVADTGALTPEAAKLVRCNTWQDSDAKEILQNVNAVVFPGGEDISPSLYFNPQEWHGIEAERDYSAERDVSDYVLMSYCLERDIPFMTICRGTQMLSVVSGAELIQDIPTWLESQGKVYQNDHRQAADAEGNRDFASVDVKVDKGSILYDIVQKEELENCPCWHHQMIANVDGTRLVATAHAQTEGVETIEAVERTDKTYAAGVQFHPEISIQKKLDGDANADEYLDYDTAIKLFKRLQEEGARQIVEDPQNLGLRPAVP